jgi:hypothetical protein
VQTELAELPSRVVDLTLAQELDGAREAVGVKELVVVDHEGARGLAGKRLGEDRLRFFLVLLG